MTDTTYEKAINVLFPAPFKGLDYESAWSLVCWALELTDGRDDEIDEALLWEIRNMPECLRCAHLLSPRFPFGGHVEEQCPERRHLRVVK